MDEETEGTQAQHLRFVISPGVTPGSQLLLPRRMAGLSITQREHMPRSMRAQRMSGPAALHAMLMHACILPSSALPSVALVAAKLNDGAQMPLHSLGGRSHATAAGLQGISCAWPAGTS